MRRTNRLLLCWILMAVMAFLGGCTSKGGVLDETMLTVPDRVLVSYYDAMTGTNGGDCSETLTLMTTGDPDKLRLEFVGKSEGEEPVCLSYDVRAEAAEECLTYIAEAGLKNWQKLKNPIAWTGMVRSCTFIDGEQYVRVSTDAMPEGGNKKLSHIGEILKGYAAEANENAEGKG